MENGYEILEPHEGPSFWQPKPANGYVVVKAAPQILSTLTFSQGIQVVPPGSHVRKHTHIDEDEVIYCLEGSGKAVLGDIDYEMAPGVSIVIGRGTSHTFLNTGSEDLKFIWTISTPGLERFFESIGIPRAPGEAQPGPFERPADRKLDPKHGIVS